MDRKWFLLLDGQISGPFSQNDIEGKITSNPSYLIWGRGQTDWNSFDKWKRQLIELSQAENAKTQTQRMWRVRMGSTEMKPMTHDQMIDYLSGKTDLSEVRIWTEGYNEWKEIYQIHKIMDQLGVSRRKHPRVPIMGQVVCESAAGAAMTLKALSISEGGLGATDAQNIRIGERFKLILKSPNLYSPIHASAEVVYIGNDGYAGMRFLGIHPESKSSIIEYVKKFTDVKPNF